MKIVNHHIVVKKLYEGDQAYILQLPDRRIIFLIPYQNKYTLIGTTDKEVSSYLNPQITNEEKKYLIDSANTFLKNSITAEDIVWTYAGIRPLLNDQNSNASKVTRDYEFDLNSSKAPIISIFGGKLTTYRKLAEHALQKLSEVMFVPNKTWTDKEKLPGSKKVQEKYFENFSQSLQKRIFDNYGDQVVTLNDYYMKLQNGGQQITKDLYEFEVAYLVEKEMANNADDILFRRTKLGIDFPKNKLDLLNKVISKYN